MNININEFKYIIAALILGGLILVFGHSVVNDKKTTAPTASVITEQELKKISIGDKNAPVTITEYTSFLCSHCVNFALNVMPNIKEKYIKTGQVKWNFVITGPTEIGQATFCADEQGKYIEYHDYLFNHQSELTKVDDLYVLATQAGLNADELKQCLESGKYKDITDNLVKNGNDKGVSGTPTFFIGKSNEPDKTEKIVGEVTFEEFEKTLIKYLQ